MSAQSKGWAFFVLKLKLNRIQFSHCQQLENENF